MRKYFPALLLLVLVVSTQLSWICGYYTCSTVVTNQYFWEGELRAGIEFGF